MQVIEFTEPGLGSFDWEMPEELADKLSELDPEFQKEVRQIVTDHVRAHLHILLGALYMGSKSSLAFNVIQTSSQELANKLLENCS